MLPFLNEDDEHQMLLKNNRSEWTPPEHGIIGSKAGLYHNVIYMKKILVLSFVDVSET